MSDADNKNQPASYSAASSELETILNDIETGNADIDELLTMLCPHLDA